MVAEHGFPSPEEAKDPISIISLYDNILKRTISFGCKPYTGDKVVTYIHCDKEVDLLKKFLKYMNKYSPDVITGWNVMNFDIPYIVNRCKTLFGQSTRTFNMLSPINSVRMWKSQKTNEIVYDIAGVTILDYYMIYKWYSPKNLASYTLDFVSKVELEKGKLDYSEYEDLNDLYRNNWNKYVDYNIIDCKRVHELEQKLGYIKLVQSLSLLTRAPMKYYNAMTQLIEGAMLTHYRRNNLCAPYFSGGSQESFEAAYVKEPIKGMHEWVSSIDITSSYPFHIIALNMSTETYIGRILGIAEDDVAFYTRRRSFPSFEMYKEDRIVKFEGTRLDNFNKALSRGLMSISPCGSLFDNNKPGVLATVEKQIFAKRKDIKQRMNKLKSGLHKLSGDEYDKVKDKANELHAIQWSLKIVLNAAFGILAVPYSRYFNTNIAEAITSCGRYSMRQGEKLANEFFHNTDIDGLPDDMVIYCDTDSAYCMCGEYFKKKLGEEVWNDIKDNEKIKLILTISKELEDYVNLHIYEDVQKGDYNSKVDDYKIEFKQEIIAKTALFVKKKKYAYWCVSDEGSKVDKLSVTGLEIVRSDSSEAVRGKLSNILELILKKTPDKKLTDLISKHKKTLKSVLPEDIAANIGINNIKKYIVDGKSIKGTPWHVKGVANYNRLLKDLNIVDNYEEIHESVKAKVVYLMNNPYGMETITFYRWPKEFNDVVQVDYNKMIEKFFLKKIRLLLEPMKKEYITEEDMSGLMDDFFS